MFVCLFICLLARLLVCWFVCLLGVCLVVFIFVLSFVPFMHLQDCYVAFVRLPPLAVCLFSDVNKEYSRQARGLMCCICFQLTELLEEENRFTDVQAVQKARDFYSSCVNDGLWNFFFRVQYLLLFVKCEIEQT